jgi:hypothetical protein
MFSGMLLHLSSRRDSLPSSTESVSAESVVYAIVKDEDDLQVNREIVLVSFMILVVGIAIGRFTAHHSPQSLSS